MHKDYAISSKSIPGTDSWNLVFTHSGKYFFHNGATNQRSWLPPQSVLKALNDHFTPTRKLDFFDPQGDGGDEEEIDGYSGEDSMDSGEESGDDIMDSEDDLSKDNTVDNHKIKIDSHKNENERKSSVPLQSSDASSSIAEDEFKMYLLKNLVNPFAPWPSINSQHSSSPQFQAIQSGKRKQELFSQVCPLLINMRREKTAEAQAWWKQILIDTAASTLTWQQILNGKLKTNQKFYPFLNEKECEKQFKASRKK